MVPKARPRAVYARGREVGGRPPQRHGHRKAGGRGDRREDAPLPSPVAAAKWRPLVGRPSRRRLPRPLPRLRVIEVSAVNPPPDLPPQYLAGVETSRMLNREVKVATQCLTSITRTLVELPLRC